MFAFIISFLILLNPFALFIYMVPLYKEQGLGTFYKILAGACLIAFVIYGSFVLFGQGLFEVLQINFEAFRIFGGIVLVSFALSFILQGKKSMITTRGEIGKIASEVALPFMVGAGTITLSILIGESLNHAKGMATLAFVMVLTFIIVGTFMTIRHYIPRKYNVMFDKNAEILLRINGFVVGAYGVGLIITGIQNILL